MFLINMKINHLNMVITVHHRRNRPTRGRGGESLGWPVCGSATVSRLKIMRVYCCFKNTIMRLNL
jgi:hypothetical protein